MLLRILVGMALILMPSCIFAAGNTVDTPENANLIYNYRTGNVVLDPAEELRGGVTSNIGQLLILFPNSIRDSNVNVHFRGHSVFRVSM